MPLAGALGDDWGACSGALSPFDGMVRFEHDGCDAFEAVRRGAVSASADPQRDWRPITDLLPAEQADEAFAAWIAEQSAAKIEVPDDAVRHEIARASDGSIMHRYFHRRQRPWVDASDGTPSPEESRP